MRVPLQALGLSQLPDNARMFANEETLPLLHTGLPWRNRFHTLGPDFFTPLAPEPLPDAYWVGRSDAVARLLGLSDSLWHSDALLAALSGNQPISGTQPLASVYSGHQFGHWAGQLGDGRAILLGETNNLELQLKGSGQTPYSRMGDGRAVLRSSIREFLCSEAMHSLGIATTRCLCVIGSDEAVPRETIETAAVVTRVAPSFIRFGHFEHFAARQQLAQLKTLADYVIEHHYPECMASSALSGNPYANLLQAVAKRTALMIAQWQAVGFCHGVMNTDNMSILGLTLDYGPFQFLDAYAPGHICNHTDRGGRYAFDQQPDIAHWNLFCLGNALMPLIVDQPLALRALHAFKQDFDHHWHSLMCDKLGLPVNPDDMAQPKSAQASLIEDILVLLATDRVDYTLFWRRLSQWVAGDLLAPVRDLFLNRPALDAWMLRYEEHLTPKNKGLAANLMLKSNPSFVLRNYLAETAIQAAKSKDFSEVARLLKLLESPFDDHPGFEHYAGLPPDWANQIEISCSS
jgi:uncharacterized protein YdiU (UPF0061 family)